MTQTDQAASAAEYLSMRIVDFFSFERLRAQSESNHLASRASNIIFGEYHRHSEDQNKMEDFLIYETRRSLARIPNSGEKTADLIVRTVQAAGLTIRDC